MVDNLRHVLELPWSFAGFAAAVWLLLTLPTMALVPVGALLLTGVAVVGIVHSDLRYRLAARGVLAAIVLVMIYWLYRYLV